MKHIGVSIILAILAGIAGVYLAPPVWFAWLLGVGCVCTILFGTIARGQTKISEPANPVVGFLLSLINLPEHPMAEVEESWALAAFLTAATFVLSLTLSIIAHA